jgi:hypothetical protein
MERADGRAGRLSTQSDFASKWFYAIYQLGLCCENAPRLHGDEHLGDALELHADAVVLGAALVELLLVLVHDAARPRAPRPAVLVLLQLRLRRLLLVRA